MFDKTQKPKIVLNPENETHFANRQQFKITSVNRKTPIEKDYIPLVSPQLSAYAKPGERIKLQLKFMRAKQNKSANHNLSNTDVQFTANYFHNEDQYFSSDDQVLQIVSGHMKSESQMQQYQRKTKRKPRTHRNIFSLFVEESLEMSQLRQKMKPRPVISQMDNQIANRRNRTYSGFQNINENGLMQQGKRCRLLKKFADIII